ncbi:MAG TPA: hypothetical protein VD862_02325 [Candidatus Paceibacterota bacterium]|nr:hypothetical protein [Candidatus Paceibacterota bacterium]
MEIKTNFIITCREAFLSAGTNNLNLINIFSTINADKFPFAYPHFALVVNLDVPETGTYALNTAVAGPDGKELARTSLSVTVKSANFQVIANFENMQFAAPGAYELKVDLDGTPVGSRTIQVNLVSSPKGKQVNVA